MLGAWLLRSPQSTIIETDIGWALQERARQASWQAGRHDPVANALSISSLGRRESEEGASTVFAFFHVSSGLSATVKVPLQYIEGIVSTRSANNKQQKEQRPGGRTQHSRHDTSCMPCLPLPSSLKRKTKKKKNPTP